MQLASVLLARCFAIFQIEDLNPKGTFFYPEITEAMVKRYNFHKFPTNVDEFNEVKGISFKMGRAGEYVIRDLTIYNSGILVDTSATTEISEEILRDGLLWISKEFGLAFNENMLKKKAYISQITFHSDAPILMLNSVLGKIAAICSKEVTANFGQPLQYDVGGMTIQFDPLTISAGTAPFTIQRREGVPFGENKYFSTAPVRTPMHYELIAQVENALSRG